MPDALTLAFILLALLAMTSVCAVVLVGMYRVLCELVTLARVQDSRERQREAPAAPAPR